MNCWRVKGQEGGVRLRNDPEVVVMLSRVCASPASPLGGGLEGEVVLVD